MQWVPVNLIVILNVITMHTRSNTKVERENDIFIHMALLNRVASTIHKL